MNNYEKTIIDKITSELNDYESTFLYLTDKVKFNQHEVVKKIITHQNNGFTTKSGKKRFFFNIGNSRVDTITKKIDFDTKDINLNTLEGGYDTQDFLLKSELKQFLKETKQAIKINELVEMFADFGNAVVKKDANEVYKKVNLANIKVIDQTAETLEDSTVIEEHNYNPTEFRRIGNQSGWENVQEALEELVDENDKNPKVYVYERNGEMTVAEFKRAKGKKPADGDEDKYIATLGIVAIDRKKSSDWYYTENTGGYGKILFLEEVEGDKNEDGLLYFKAYREAHYDAYQGRWLRRGIREKLFDIQDRANVLGNQIYEAMKWSSQHIFYSSDRKIAGRNILESIQQGQIIFTDHLATLAVEERNLSANVNEWNRLMELADREAQAFEVATGEGLSSGTTLGQVQIQTAAVGEHFNFKREKLALMYKEIFNDWMIDKLISNINVKHTLEISGTTEYYEQFFEAAAKSWVAVNYLKMAALSGNIMTKEQANQLKEMRKAELVKKPKQTLQILKDYYKNVKMKFDIDITGESINRQTKVTNGISLLPYVTNPTIMQDPIARGIVSDIADSLGFKVSKAGTAPQPAQQQPQPAQGKRPEPNANPDQTTNQQTI